MKQMYVLKNEQKLSMKQNMMLTQQMKLSINILAMSIEKLNNFLEEEINQNPHIELKFFSNSNSPQNYDYENTLEIDNISQEKNFFEELEEQISFLNLDRKTKEICIFIVNNLNEKGYLIFSRKDLLKELKIEEKELEKILELIHSFEPCGIGAFNLEDCLKIQLKQKGILDEKLFKLVDKYLLLIAEQKFELIKAKLNIDDDTLKKYIYEIKKLNPIPTRGYNIGKIKKIMPEIIVKKNGEKYICNLNNNVVPQIIIKNEEKLDKNFYRKINEIIRAVEKRYSTLLKIAEVLVSRQESFFEEKSKILNTLKIIDIAEDLSLNPSTISRAIREKYMLTDKGTFAFKDLICINSEALEEKKYIEKYIETEDKENPYSDEELAKFLNREGFKIARRTVSKYRKELGYKTSALRKV